jgi:hypothetical protein
MAKQYIESSNIVSLDFNSDEETLLVEFKGGANYEYYNFPKEEYEGIISSRTPGKRFHSIKNQYSFSKI